MGKDRNYLINMYNATSTDKGNDELETYEEWLERQLLARIEKIEKMETNRAVDLAYFQIAGWKSRDAGEDLNTLLTGLNLEKEEWEIVQKNYSLVFLNESDRTHIKEYFEKPENDEAKSMSEKFGDDCDAAHRMSEAKKLK